MSGQTANRAMGSNLDSDQGWLVDIYRLKRICISRDLAHGTNSIFCQYVFFSEMHVSIEDRPEHQGAWCTCAAFSIHAFFKKNIGGGGGLAFIVLES